MAIEVTLPKLGLTMEEGTVEEWLVADGDAITVGTPLLRLATDKIDVDVEAEADGIIAIAVGNGATLPPGAVLGWLLAPGEAAPAGAAPAAASGSIAADDSAAGQPQPATSQPETRTMAADGGRQFVSPNARRVASELGVDVTQIAGSGPNGRVVSQDVEAAARAGTAKVTSPLARRDANAAGINVHAMDTANGVVTRKDVREAISGTTIAATPSAAAASSSAALPALQETASIIPLKGMRGTIAARMVQSLTEMAQLTHGFEVCMEEVVALRGTLKEQYRDLGMSVPSLNDFVVRAAALALRKHPILNATIVDKEKCREEMSEFKRFLENLSPTDFNFPPGPAHEA